MSLAADQLEYLDLLVRVALRGEHLDEPPWVLLTIPSERSGGWVPAEEWFGVVVIGSGPAGEKAAAQAAYFGKRVAVVERSASPGGAAVSNAGIPTKTLRETALYITGFRRREVYGLRLTLDPEATVAQLRTRTAEVIETMTDAVRRNLERHAIQFVRGDARLGSHRCPQLRAAIGLCRSQRERGRAEHASGLLSDTYATFTEGFTTPDLIEAADLLESLPRESAGGRRPGS